MKLQKRFVLLLALVFVVSSTPLLTGSQLNNYEEYNYNRLKQMALTNGYIRVIAKMDVPGIEVLTALSTGFKTGNSGKNKVFMQDAFNADLALDEAIAKTRDTVLYRLNGTLYRVNRTYSTLPYVALTVTPEALERLKSLVEVLRIAEDKRIPLPVTGEAQADNGNSGVDQTHLSISLDIVDAPVAWGFGYTGQGWYVAVLDTGIRSSHDMFQGKSIVEHCFSLGEDWFDTVNGGCPNGLTEMDGPGAAAHPEGPSGHGSHVAGIAAGNNGSDRFGVAKDAGIIAVQVFTYFSDENDVAAWQSDTLRGLEYVYTMRNTYRIASVNMSLGSSAGYSEYCDSAIRADAVNNLRNAGIATVISSGNESRCNAVADPACIRGAITVNGSSKQDNEYSFGNWHDEMVDLMAPGTDIISADGNNDTGYVGKSGTSMSAPHVAGAWAIMKQYDENMTIDDILTTLQNSGLMISSTRCPDRIPKARINIGDALTSLLLIAPPQNLTADQQTNKAFLQTEYINELTWEANPLNADKNVANYRIYLVGNGNQLTLLTEVNSSNFRYWHRNVNRRETMTYAITAVNDQGEESLPYYHTTDF